MSFPELTAFARHLERTSPDDHDEHLLNSDRARELFEYVRKRDAPELAAVLDAASTLVEILAGPSMRVSRAEILAMACQAVRAVERGVSLQKAEGPSGFSAIEREKKESTANGHATTPRNGTADPKADDTNDEDDELEITVDLEDEEDDEVEAKKNGAPQAPVVDVSVEAFDDDETLEPIPGPDKLEPSLDSVNDMVLGKMLIELGHATRNQVARALRMHRDKGLPVGECLLVQGVSPDRLLDTLKLQKELRSAPTDPAGKRAAEVRKKVAEEQARAAREMRGIYDDASPSAAMKAAGMRVTASMFIGEVLLGAGMINNEQLAEAMNIHHLEGIRVGDALLRIQALTPEELAKGLELHKRLRAATGLAR